MPQADPQPNPDNAVSSNRVRRRTFGDWFRRGMKRSRNRMPDQIPLQGSGRNRTPGQSPSEDPSRNRIPEQTPSEDPSQTDTPQARALPSNNNSSTLAPAQRIRVGASCPFSTSRARISDHLAQRAVQRIDDVRSFVYPLMNIVIYFSSQDEPPPPFRISMPSWICCGRTGHTGEAS